MTNLTLLNKEDLKEAILEVILPLMQNHQHNNPRTIQINESDLLSRKEAAAYLKITLPTLHAWTRQGTIECKRIEGRVYYLRSDLKMLLK